MERESEDAWFLPVMHIPLEMLQFLCLGAATCADLFLHHFTHLPLRCLELFGLILTFQWSSIRRVHL